MEKTVPVWVVSEFASMTSGSIQEEIKGSVRRYVNGEYGGENEFNEYDNDLDAQSTKPEEFKIEGYDVTVEDVLDSISGSYSCLVDINTQLQLEDISTEEIQDLDVQQIEDAVGDKLIKDLRAELNELPVEVKKMFARNHDNSIGGRDSDPEIGPAGDVMKVLEKNERL